MLGALLPLFAGRQIGVLDQDKLLQVRLDTVWFECQNKSKMGEADVLRLREPVRQSESARG